MDARSWIALAALAAAIATPIVIWACKVVGNLASLNVKMDLFLQRCTNADADHRELERRVDVHDVQLAELRAGTPRGCTAG